MCWGRAPNVFRCHKKYSRLIFGIGIHIPLTAGLSPLEQVKRLTACDSVPLTSCVGALLQSSPSKLFFTQRTRLASHQGPPSKLPFTALLQSSSSPSVQGSPATRALLQSSPSQLSPTQRTRLASHQHPTTPSVQGSPATSPHLATHTPSLPTRYPDTIPPKYPSALPAPASST